MIDGRNCTDEALFPRFPTQNIVFAATFEYAALLESITTDRRRHNFSERANRITASVN